MDEDFRLSRGVIDYLGNFDFSFFVSRNNIVHQATCGDSIGNLGNAQNAFLFNFNLCADTQLAASQAIIVVARIHDASGGKIRKQFKRFFAQCFDTCLK